MTLDQTNINTLWATLIVEELLRSGCDHFIVSPGSRSTPLTAAVARHPRAHKLVAYDERGAAFLALGYGRATRRAAVLICTSGTAAANYFPAVIEAEIDRVPLIVLSADRPPELRQTLANQTIDQVNLYGNKLRWFFDLPTPDEAIAPQMVLTTVAQAVYRAQGSPAGPVHLNCMFREPLAPTPAPLSAAYLAAHTARLADYARATAPHTTYATRRSAPDDATRAQLVDLLNTTAHGLVVIGQLQTDAERAAVRNFVQLLGWPALADITSGLRLGAADAPFVPHFDAVLLSTTVDDHPQVVIHIGGQFVSKRLLQFQAALQRTQLVLLKDEPTRHDPNHAVTLRIEADIPTALSTVVHQIRPLVHRPAVHAWAASWRLRGQVVAQILSNLDTGGALNEVAIARAVARALPADHALFIGNSMPIRDFDMYAAHDGAAVPVAANRGASGIDGVLASAIGYAIGLQRPTTLVIGDLSLLHDLNSLTLLRHPDVPPITIVTVNNAGGGIFHLLPVAQFDDLFEPYFGTPHAYALAPIAAAFGVATAEPPTAAAFNAALAAAHAGCRHTLIELRTERVANAALHRQLQDAVRAALAAARRPEGA